MEQQTGATVLTAPAEGASTMAGGGGAAPAPLAGGDPTLADPTLADPTLADPGLAAAPAGGLEATLRHAWEILLAGGPVVMILLALSVVALAIVLVKLWQFRAARLGDRRTARRALSLYRTGRSGEALALAGRSRNPVARVLVRAINGRARRDLPEAMVREEVVRYGADLLESLRGWFRPLEVIGSLAPLLGLFGTVLGMISAFQQLEEAGSQVDPSILSGGIWEALLTTAVGLAVAMPVIVLLNWLERRVDRLAHEMDDCVTQVFTEDLSFAPVAEERSHGGLEGRTAALVAGR
ncbi:biopolymer transport protein ExbB [Tistlia consotensis]|uniref:Biopolymer transport protein ExbB n=1 Tax=Tistlia consotensis USBA 355 TaxID=560819 RepID=A0A1Y6BMM5_9PROT|nr:MotA/TolQ/ExbB proton channel family protein [Tistlia consotensis]SMF19336.1 biopolymer transport protein ExbB [Tistlia consotensis USBA 355]SNR39014.1 biopolymer transport protein ExbB [Tistlia consotensis]